MVNDIRLSKNFMLSELVKSSTADRLGIDNWPSEQWIVDKLTKTCNNLLQPVRDHYGVPIRPNSGYRCLTLNRALGSKDTSQHIRGEAVDVEVWGVTNYDLAEWMMNNLDFDQLILENYDPQKGPNSGWVHCSYVEGSNSNNVLTYNRRTGYTNGLLT